MEILGRATINPIVYYSGKLCGYIVWTVLGLQLANVKVLDGLRCPAMGLISGVVLCGGLAVTGLSLITLGRSTRLGLPAAETRFKSGGIYRFSRNPMYIGFNLITCAAMLYALNAPLIIMGLYSIVVYHFIIKGEEKFLENRFGKEYLDYKKSVRRYL